VHSSNDAFCETKPCAVKHGELEHIDQNESAVTHVPIVVRGGHAYDRTVEAILIEIRLTFKFYQKFVSWPFLDVALATNGIERRLHFHCDRSSNIRYFLAAFYGASLMSGRVEVSSSIDA
jgi:hypothetical protein